MDNLTVIIPFCDGHATIDRLLHSLPADLPIIVVDDVSDDPPAIDKPGVRILKMARKGYFAGACNAGIQSCKTDVLMLNQDAHFTGSRWLDFIGSARDIRAAIAGDGVFGHPAWPMGYVQGTFMYMSRAAIDKVGLLNEIDYPLWGCTCEWQLRACRAGFAAVPSKDIPDFVHEREGKFGQSITRQIERESEKKSLFIRTPPAVSVIIPCYNYGRFLPDAIASLIGGKSSLGVVPPQTFQSFEIIIVDDVSTDNSAKIAAGLADEWKAIRFIQREKNGGTPEANNTGIEAARGKYITILSADDMRESTSLEMLYREQIANQHSLIYDDIMHFQDGRRLKAWEMLDYDFERLLYKNHIHAGIMFPRSAWVEVKGYPDLMRQGREDWAFNVLLGLHGYCGIHVRQPGYLYRLHGNNRHFANAGKGWREHFVDQMKKLFPNVYTGERPMACCGGGAKSAPSSNTSFRSGSSMLPGADGMTLIEYNGLNTAPTTWYGPVTQTVYLFGGKRKTGYVDNRDVKGFLEMIHNKHPLFALAQAVKPKPAQPEPVQLKLEPVIAAEPEAVDPLDGSMFVMDAAAVLDQNTRTVNAYIDENLENMDDEQLKALYAAEKDGKARKSILSRLEGYLNA